MTAFLDKSIETVIITILHTFKKIEDTCGTRMGLYWVSSMGGQFGGDVTVRSEIVCPYQMTWSFHPCLSISYTLVCSVI